MKLRWDLAAVAAILVSSAAASAAVLSDTTPPQLKSFQFTPSVVDTSTNDQFITVTARATDDLSGLVGGYDAQGRAIPGVLNVVFASPVANSSGYAYASLFAAATNLLDLTWTGQLRVPRNSHVGTWTLAEIRAVDGAGNVGRFTAMDVRALGSPTTFQNTGLEDRTPPELLSLTLETNKVDATSVARNEVKFKGVIREELSGFGSFDDAGRAVPSMLIVQLSSPSKNQIVGMAQLRGDDPVEMPFEGSFLFPPHCEAGLWRLESVRCSDNAGNQMPLYAADQFSGSFAIEVTSDSDTAPPQLRSLTFSRRRIDASTNAPSVGVSCEAVDDLSGLFTSTGSVFFAGGASGIFQSPSRKQQASLYLYASGSPLNAAFSGFAYFSQYSEAGVWTLRSFSLRDVAGNVAGYDNLDLQRLGFPTEIAVGVAPQLSITHQGNSILFSWPAWASDMNVETSESISASQWQRPQTVPSIIGEKCVLVVAPSAGQQFYRLAE